MACWSVRMMLPQPGTQWSRLGASLTPLRILGLRPSQGRKTALFALAAEIPAAILAKMLGIHIKSAIQWQKLSTGDWAAYAAEVSQRNAEPDTAFQQFE